MAKYTGTELFAPKGHEEVGPKVYQIWGEVLSDKLDLGLHAEWVRNKELVRNKHWRNKTDSGVPLVSVNLIHAHVQRTCNTMTDNNPTFNVSKVGDVEQIDPKYFEDLGHAVDYWWGDQEQGYQRAMNYFNAFNQYGVDYSQWSKNEAQYANIWREPK